MELRGKVALVTGAAHRLGKAIALALARQGAHIALHYGSSVEAALQTVVEITALGVDVFPVQADLADPARIAALFEAVQARFGRLDVLVNSAASFEKRPFDAISPDDWDRVMAVNLRAPFLCSQRAARLMRASPRPAGEAGLIVNIADLSGVYAWPGYAHHGISKAGLIHLTKVAARELAPAVRVNAIVPGPILPPPGIEAGSAEWAHIGERVPLGRPGDPSDIGRAVVFFAESDFITGAVIPLDGGEGLIGK